MVLARGTFMFRELWDHFGDVAHGRLAAGQNIPIFVESIAGYLIWRTSFEVGTKDGLLYQPVKWRCL